MIEINKVINEKIAALLEDVNSYLIDERMKAKSDAGRQAIDKLIAHNFEQLIEIKEGGENKNGKKI